MAHPGAWLSQGPEAFMQGSYRQPYEALAGSESVYYGREQMLPTQTAFSTRYYDTAYDNRSFMQSVEQPAEPSPIRSNVGPSNVGPIPQQAKAKGSKRKPQPEGTPMSDYVQYVKDHMSRLFLWWGALLAGIFAIATASVAIQASLSEEFQAFSTLAWESWFPSFSAMMLVFTVLSLCALAAAVAAAYVGWKESRPALRALFISSATLGCIMLCVTLLAWLYGARAQPYVVQAANLLCQDIARAFGCPPVSTTSLPTAAQQAAVTPAAEAIAPVGRRRLGGLRPAGAGGSAARAAVSFLAGFQGERRGSQRGPPARRLDTATAASKYAGSFNPDKDITGTSELCRMLEQLCQPPADFDAATACVCSGEFWAADSRLKSRRLEASEHWRGAQGAYCAAWEPESLQGDWCFVSPYQLCGNGTKHTLSKGGHTMTRSSGPCGDEVESRSQFVLDGLSAMSWPLELSTILGLLLLTMAGCGVLLYRVPSKKTIWHTDRGLRPKRQELGSQEGGKPAPERPQRPLQERFDEAQREAVRKLNDTTPDDLKFTLYGFYKQAKEGDVGGNRPGFFDRRERAKYDAWAQHRGMSEEEAVEGYIKTVALLNS